MSHKDKLDFKISDYFSLNDESLNTLTPKERSYVKELRDDINSFRTVQEQIDFIEARRTNPECRDFDSRVFNIDEEATFNPSFLKGINQDLLNKHYNMLSQASPDKYTKRDVGYSQTDSKIVNGFKRLGFNKTGNVASKVLTNPVFFLKAALTAIIIILVVNFAIFAAGIVSSSGKTPFVFCNDGKVVGGSGVGPSNGTKEKDGYKLPMAHYDGYNGKNYNGDDSKRGNGVYASEDFAWDGTSKFSEENYAVAGRWEYVSYRIIKNKYPAHAKYGTKTPDGCMPNKDVDSSYYKWICKQKVLVVNPENKKGVVCMVGNGKNNPNWGGSPLSAGPLGLSYKAQAALGFKAGSGDLDGGDYPTNCRDSNVELQAYWVDEDTPLGPTEATGGGTDRDCSNISGGGNSSIAEAAVSLCATDDTIGQGVIKDLARHRNPDPRLALYNKVHDLVGGDGYYASCDRFVCYSVRWSGADDNYALHQTNSDMEKSDRWKEVKEGEDSEPGDVAISISGGYHTYIVINSWKGGKWDQNYAPARAKFPNSKASKAQASYDDHQPAVKDLPTPWFDGQKRYRVWRNVKPQENSKYKTAAL